MYKTNVEAVMMMCLILFAYKAHPEYKLIVAANRDESYTRPTATAGYWEDEPSILAGRDLEKMGTWMGVTTGGRFAALTNYRDPKEMNAVGKLSRGELVADFLKGAIEPSAYMSLAAQKQNQYPGYNLLAGDASSLYYYSNVEGIVRAVKPGIHGLSNHFLNTPWPKVQRGKKGMKEIFNKSGINIKSELYRLLQHAEPARDADLPDTGVGLEWERMLSPLFIKSIGYGTRCSTILLMKDNHISYSERIYSEDGFSENDFSFPI